MRAPLVALAQHVEQEQVHVIVERLVVEEELGQVAEVLAELLLLAPVHLKHGQGTVAVNLVPGRMVLLAAADMAQQVVALLEELQAESRVWVWVWIA